MLDGFAFMLKHLLRAAVEPLEAQLTMFDCIPETDAAAKADIFFRLFGTTKVVP
jgi:hypothetical protein